MEVKKLTLQQNAYPSRLREIAGPPNELYYIGTDPSEWLTRPRVAIVGSRHVSPYGQQVTAQLARELAEKGVVIISGLALGVDGIAHQACLDAGGTTVAVLAGGVDKLQPATNEHIGRRLLKQGGTVLSEYPVGTTPYPSNFIARNRIVAGLADALLITEAAERSGTLHTARFAMEQGRDVFAVPGNITSPGSAGTNNLIKSGAMAVTSVDDILFALGLELAGSTGKHRGANADEQALINLLEQGITDGHELLAQTQLAPALFSQTLTMLEIGGKIRALGSNHWALK